MLFFLFDHFFRKTKELSKPKKYFINKQNLKPCNLVFYDFVFHLEVTNCNKSQSVNSFIISLAVFIPPMRIHIFLKLLCQCNTPMKTVITTVFALLYCIFTNFTSCIKLLKNSTLVSVV